MSSITFKRLCYRNGGPLGIKDVVLDTKTIEKDDILVKVHYAALNPVDMILYNSSWLMFFKRNEKSIGRDFSGVVEQVGSDITEFAVGDQVSGLFEPIYTEQGTLSQYLVLKPTTSSVGKIPSNLTLEQAASFPLVFATAYNTVRSFHKPTKSSKVLVIGGATAVGYYTIQLLKNHFETENVASINSASSSELVKGLGADFIIDYTEGNVAKQVKSIVDNKFQGEKFDLIIDCVGSDDVFPVIDDVLKPKNTSSGYVTIVGDKIADYNQSMLKFFNIGTIWRLFPFFRSYNYGFVSTAFDYYSLAKDLFEQGKLTPYIDSVYDLEDYPVALKKLGTHKARGKIVINTNSA